jgi:hypothetical protein
LCSVQAGQVERLLGDVERLSRDYPDLSARIIQASDRLGPLQTEMDRFSNDARELRHLVLSMNHWLSSLRQNLSALELAEAEQVRSADALYADVASRVLGADAARSQRLDQWADRFAQSLPRNAPTLDLGSGEDWLARLVARGLEATGVDANSRIGMRARDAGLMIAVAEPPAVLTRTADQSLQGLTSLDVGSLLRRVPALTLLDAVQRVLQPDGLVLFGFGSEPGAIAGRLEGRGIAALDADLLAQALLVAGFVDVTPLTAADGTVCLMARNRGKSS